jgi:hypothetical protein
VLLMVEPDGGDCAGDGTNDVGRVEPAAEADFDDRDLDLGAPEHLERHRSRHLEERRRHLERAVRPQPLDERQDVSGDGMQRRRVNGGAADHEPFRQVGEVGRDVARGPDAGRHQRRMRHRGHRALAVGARDVERGEAALGVAERVTQARDVLETQLDPEHLERENAV